MSANPFHLAWFLNGCKVQTWNAPFAGPGGRHLNSAELYIDLARSLERSGFDYILLEDSSYVPDGYTNSMEPYLAGAYMVPKWDPAVMGSILTQFTSKLGIATTLSTSEYHPYMLARQMATMDQASQGRCGWNMVTGSSDLAAQNYGRDAMPPHDERYLRADEFCDAVFQLWDSWAADAIVEDRERGVYIDHTRVKVVDFVGEYYKTRGPLNVPRSPQGRPVTVQAGGSSAGRAFASKWADTIVGNAGTPDEMKDYRDDVRAQAPRHGRTPDDIKVLFLTSVTVGATDEDARREHRAAQEAAHADPIDRLLGIGFAMNLDFSTLDLDRPFKEQSEGMSTNGHQSSLNQLIDKAGDRTLREVLSDSGKVELVGSPDTVAAQMDELMQHVGGDGFLFTQSNMTRHSWARITDGLVPALQRRGLVRREYAHTTLRENLFEF